MQECGRTRTRSVLRPRTDLRHSDWRIVRVSPTAESRVVHTLSSSHSHRQPACRRGVCSAESSWHSALPGLPLPWGRYGPSNCLDHRTRRRHLRLREVADGPDHRTLTACSCNDGNGRRAARRHRDGSRQSMSWRLTLRHRYHLAMGPRGQERVRAAPWIDRHLAQGARAEHRCIHRARTAGVLL